MRASPTLRDGGRVGSARSSRSSRPAGQVSGNKAAHGSGRRRSVGDTECGSPGPYTALDVEEPTDARPTPPRSPPRTACSTIAAARRWTSTARAMRHAHRRSTETFASELCGHRAAAFGAVREAHAGGVVQRDEREHEAGVAVRLLLPGTVRKDARLHRRRGATSGSQTVRAVLYRHDPATGGPGRLRHPQLRVHGPGRHVGALGPVLPRPDRPAPARASTGSASRPAAPTESPATPGTACRAPAASTSTRSPTARRDPFGTSSSRRPADLDLRLRLLLGARFAGGSILNALTFYEDASTMEDHDLGLAHDLPLLINRRRALGLLAGGVGLAVAACGSSESAGSGQATTATTSTATTATAGRRDPGGDRRPVPGRRLERAERPHRERRRAKRHHEELRRRVRHGRGGPHHRST